MKYRKRPVVIEAWLFGGKEPAPAWLENAYRDGQTVQPRGDKIVIKTLEGEMLASYGDYIIQGVNGELYPCKPDVFYKSYEALPAGAA